MDLTVPTHSRRASGRRPHWARRVRGLVLVGICLAQLGCAQPVAANTLDDPQAIDARAILYDPQPAASADEIAHRASARDRAVELAALPLFQVVEPADLQRTDSWFRSGLALVALILIVVIGWVHALRRMVAQRTLEIRNELAMRTAAEEQLRASELKYRLLTEYSSDVVWTVDRNGYFAYLSPSVTRLLGYTPEEVIGQRLGAFSGPESSANVNELLRQYLDKDKDTRLVATTPMVSQHTKKDGSTVWAETIASPMYDDDNHFIGLTGVTRDITDRLQQEVQMRRLIKRLRLATDIAGIGVWDWNFADGSLDWDERMYEIYGIPEELRNAKLDYTIWRARVHPDDLALAEPAQGDPDRISSEWAGKYRIVLPDGAVRHIQANTIMDYDRNGRPLRMIGVNRDVTDQMMYDQLLQHSNAELEQRVNERTAQLRAAIAELERANAGKDAFMAAVSHELRTPLTGILVMAETLRSQARGPLTESQARFVEVIWESGQRLLEMINGVMRYTYVMAAVSPPPGGRARLVELCAVALDEIQPKVAGKEQSVSLEVDPVDVEIYSDSGGVVQILKTLLDNAVKFTPPNGRLGIRVCAADQGETVRITVWDNGIGISAAQLPFLFKPFTQLDQRLAREFEGLGLGLAFVKREVELLGGAITVESQTDAGSRFIVTLPTILPLPTNLPPTTMLDHAPAAPPSLG